MTACLLIEIGVEELPPKAMRPLAESLATGLAAQLDQAGISHGAAKPLATPRRLAVQIADTARASSAEAVERKGPKVDIAFDADGRPTKAGEGFARSVGVAIDALEIEDSSKGRRLVYRGVAEGRPLIAQLQLLVDAALGGLPIPKRMRWGNSESAFVRPVHWLVALHGRETLPLELFGERAGRSTLGHRFHHPQSINIADADFYVDNLESPGHVVVDIDHRRRMVIRQVVSAGASLGTQARVSDWLVDEVVALVEWPVGVAGRFDARYLELPREVIVATLEGHQRCFPVENTDGSLMAGFVAVANISSREPGQIVAGNERVVSARLADALFFWSQDRRYGLAAQLPKLASVTFQQSLGSIADKSQRIGRIAAELTAAAGADRQSVARAAQLAKADLVTEMVDEFPELQGVMGRYYAESEGELADVARAIAEHYSPIGAGARIAESPAGRCIALADRLDTLAGIFAINKRPSGDKDPFGLRRAALGVLRTLIEGDISANLYKLLEKALLIQPVETTVNTLPELWTFHVERLRGYYQDQNVPAAHFDAIAALGITDMTDFDRRIKAVGEFARLGNAAVICAAHKRIRNILKRADTVDTNRSIDTDTRVAAAEQQLYTSLQTQYHSVDAAVAQGDYAGALSALAPLAQPLDRFFDEVMVMADDPTLRHNRLALLAGIDQLCRRVADISCLSTERLQN